MGVSGQQTRAVMREGVPEGCGRMTWKPRERGLTTFRKVRDTDGLRALGAGEPQ